MNSYETALQESADNTQMTLGNIYVKFEGHI